MAELVPIDSRLFSQQLLHNYGFLPNNLLALHKGP